MNRHCKNFNVFFFFLFFFLIQITMFQQLAHKLKAQRLHWKFSGKNDAQVSLLRWPAHLQYKKMMAAMGAQLLILHSVQLPSALFYFLLVLSYRVAIHLIRKQWQHFTSGNAEQENLRSLILKVSNAFRHLSEQLVPRNNF